PRVFLPFGFLPLGFLLDVAPPGVPFADAFLDGALPRARSRAWGSNRCCFATGEAYCREPSRWLRSGGPGRGTLLTQPGLRRRARRPRDGRACRSAAAAGRPRARPCPV